MVVGVNRCTQIGGVNSAVCSLIKREALVCIEFCGSLTIESQCTEHRLLQFVGKEEK